MVEYSVCLFTLSPLKPLLSLISQIQLQKSMKAQDNPYHPYVGFKVPEQLRGFKDATLGYSYADIRAHCQRVTKLTPNEQSNCINLNCAAQKYYIDCFETLMDKKQCIKNLRFEVEQNGQYRISHLKTD